jgi:hypothetical protein
MPAARPAPWRDWVPPAKDASGSFPSGRLPAIASEMQVGCRDLADVRISNREEKTGKWPSRWLDGFFQVLRRAEGDLLAGLDLDGLASRRVAAHAGGTLADLQDTQAGDADALAFL